MNVPIENPPNPPNPAHRVVLVDSREGRRQLMRLVVSGDDAVAILVGEAQNAAAAVETVEREQADVALLDVQMPVEVGLKAIAALRERHPHLAIIACSFDLSPETVKRVLAHGADRCLAKPVNRTDIPKALAGLADHGRASAGAVGEALAPVPAIVAR